MARDSLYGPCVQPIVGASRYLYIRESSILFRSWFAASRRGVGPVNANYRSASRGDPKRKSTSQSLLVEARRNGSLSCRHKRKKAMFLRAGGCGFFAHLLRGGPANHLSPPSSGGAGCIYGLDPVA